MILPGTQDKSYLSEWNTFFKAVITLYKLRGVFSEGDFADKRARMQQWCDPPVADWRGLWARLEMWLCEIPPTADQNRGGIYWVACMSLRLSLRTIGRSRLCVLL
jgi:hypothetical protein